MHQYSAHLATDRDCLDSDMCDVTVLRDEITTYQQDEHGEYTIPVWESRGDPLFWSELAIRHDAEDMQPALALASIALGAAGWRATPGAKWEPVGTGCTITVERAE